MWARDILTQEQKDAVLKQLGPPLEKARLELREAASHD